MTLRPAPAEVPPAFRAAILRARPDLADARLAVEGRGWDSVAVDADDRWIFKFPERAEAEAALLREARLLAAVRPALTMPVPDMAIHPGPPLLSGHAKLPGKILLREEYEALDRPARDRLAEDIALFLAELHAVPPAAMTAAGAVPVAVWDTRDETLEPVWPLLPAAERRRAREATAAYRRLGPDPLGTVYGFFDLHGWNVAFDHEAGRLRGIFDFADSGFGPVHREFAPVSLISPDLARRAIAAYRRRTGRAVDPARVFLLTAAMRLSELAGAIEAGQVTADTLRNAIEWFEQAVGAGEPQKKSALRPKRSTEFGYQA